MALRQDPRLNPAGRARSAPAARIALGCAAALLVALAGACHDGIAPRDLETVGSVAVVPASLSMRLGTTARLRAAVLGQAGDTLTGRTVTWQSNDPTVVAVRDSGIAVATGIGVTRLTATADGHFGTASVTVSEVPVARVAITPAQQTLAIGAQTQLTAAAYDSAGNVLAGRQVTWAASNSVIATVSSTGLVGASGVGEDTITATVEDLSAIALITVTSPSAPANVQGLWDWTESFAAPPGGYACTDTGTYALTQNGTTVIGRSSQVGVCVSGSDTIENVRSDSVPTGGVGPTSLWFTVGFPGSDQCTYTGTVSTSPPDTIQGTAVCGNAQGTWRAVRNLPVAKVVVTPDSALMVKGGSEDLSATLSAADGQPLFFRDVGWSVADNTVATVASSPDTPFFALATAVGAGATAVTASVGGQTGTAMLRVIVVHFASVVAGGYTSCGLDAAGAAYCWGEGYGDAPSPAFGGSSVAGLALGFEVGCALLTGGTSISRGYAMGDSTTATPLASITAAGGATECDYYGCYYYAHACGIAVAGGAYCWGNNESGELGDGTTDDDVIPVPVSGPTLVAISAGAFHTCGLTVAGAAYCWGLNTSGQLGVDTLWSISNSTVPLPVRGGLTFKSISASDDHTCALTMAGAAYCWGGSGLGNGSDGARNVPVEVADSLTFTALTTGPAFSCGLVAGGQVYCWGAAPWIVSGGLVPAPVLNGYAFTSMSAGTGDAHLCGIATDGYAYCIGDNNAGQLGNGSEGFPGGTVYRVLGQP